MDGKIFGINFKSDWKRNYNFPKNSLTNIDLFNPNIEIKNTLETKDKKKFNGKTEIIYAQDKLKYNFNFIDNQITINSPENKDVNFNINSNIRLKPFYFDGSLLIKNKKVEMIIDNILVNLFLYDQKYLGNFNGILKIKFNELNNKLIKSGFVDIIISEKKIDLKNANFDLGKIGNIETTLLFNEKEGVVKFISQNQLNINDHIEFAKIFQIGSKKIKNIKKIYFNLEKNIGESDFIIKNIRINDTQNLKKSEKIFFVKNIQNLRSYIRQIID